MPRKGEPDWSQFSFFDKDELKCKCGCNHAPMNHEFMVALDTLRMMYGKPLHITSGYRCTSHNEYIGGSKNSQHTKGLAVDIAWDHGPDKKRLLGLAYDLDFKGIGIAKTFLHVDMREGKETLWTY